jgi:hypothetical protein
MLTPYGACAVTFMMLMYWLELIWSAVAVNRWRGLEPA